jgi:fructokinase
MSTALITGEVLFDIFEDGSSILGGAPFNVAWHLQGFGLSPLLVSAVGQDKNGDEIREAMHAWGMSTQGIQIDSQHPTGTVKIVFNQGVHRFEIVKDVAYDFIQPPALENTIDNCKILYHGSLAMRSPVSRQTITQLRADTHLPVFVDVNLRAPFWDASDIKTIVQGADWVKLNDEELRQLADKADDDLVTTAQRFREQNKIGGMIVTRGDQGAFMVNQNQVEIAEAAAVEKMVDTVGAGDGFSAMTIAGLIQGWDFKEILQSASLFAAKICGLRGAVSKDRSFYDDFMDDIH